MTFNVMELLGEYEAARTKPLVELARAFVEASEGIDKGLALGRLLMWSEGRVIDGREQRELFEYVDPLRWRLKQGFVDGERVLSQ